MARRKIPGRSSASHGQDFFRDPRSRALLMAIPFFSRAICARAESARGIVAQPRGRRLAVQTIAFVELELAGAAGRARTNIAGERAVRIPPFRG